MGDLGDLRAALCDGLRRLLVAFRALEGSGLTWYRCPRGHPYTVGERGRGRRG